MLPILARNDCSSLWRHFRSALLSILFLLIGVVAATAGGSVVAGPAPAVANSPTGCQWSIIPSLNPEVYNSFHGVAAVSANDIWAVGSMGPGNFGQLTLIQHWDGNAWSTVSSPSPGNNQNELEDVVALASNDVWAAGYINVFSGSNSQTLFLHWDGTTWSRINSPNPGNSRNIINSLDAVAPNDIWAVGYSWPSGNRHQTMILHWDGNAWSAVPSPNLGAFDNHLSSVSAVAPNDVWAAGHYIESSGKWQTLLLHWDGSAWSVAPSPNVPAMNNHLASVSMLSADEGWAVGLTCVRSDCFENNFGTQTEELLILQWDGVAWSTVSNPELDGSFALFRDVTAVSSNNVWAVGTYGTNASSKTLTMNWDGSSWNHVPSPNPSQSCCPVLDAVTALPNGDLWAVGGYHVSDHIVFRTLAEHYPASCGSTVTPTPVLSTATATSTSVPSTLTATQPPASTNTPTSNPATGTPLVPTVTSMATSTGVPTSAPTDTPAPPVPTQTPTTCSILFSDVPEGSTFYTFVRCLACRGILGGYSDGTFRPGNSVTRGQLSKIVSNAAGWTDAHSEQSFEDVPLDHTFYIFIERMSSRGIIGGYACGGPGEPCVAPTDRPYFRPANNATRGQIAKIVSDAAGFIGAPVDQSFEDVSPTHTFYPWVERLAARAIMFGYPCGGPGEPCISPTNRPYFRPAGTTTRGQTAKIVANALFPGCAILQR